MKNPKCPYGNHQSTSSIDQDGNIFACEVCECNYKFHKEIMIDTIWIPKYKNYNIFIDFEFKTTKLLKRKILTPIMSLDYVVNVNSNNANECVDRLLNLKVFS